jgi:hypothetical protein
VSLRMNVLRECVRGLLLLLMGIRSRRVESFIYVFEGRPPREQLQSIPGHAWQSNSIYSSRRGLDVTT